MVPPSSGPHDTFAQADAPGMRVNSTRMPEHDLVTAVLLLPVGGDRALQLRFVGW
jgi:hypothetical protein